MPRATKIDPAKIPELEVLMRLEPDSMGRIKLRALWLVARGSLSRVDIARGTGLSLSALRLLVNRFNTLGAACLKDARVGNARPRLVPDLVLPTKVLNARAVQGFLLEHHAINVSLSTAQRWLHRVTRDIV